MSKELYQEALRHISPLGTVPEGSTAVPGRAIQLHDVRKTHDDLHMLANLADNAANSFDQVSCPLAIQKAVLTCM